MHLDLEINEEIEIPPEDEYVPDPAIQRQNQVREYYFNQIDAQYPQM